MARRLDKILVIDVEATCWEKNSSEKQISEIIQVGLVILNTEDLRELNRLSYLIKPRYSNVSEFCTKLTGITSKDVKSTNCDFPTFCKKIKERIPHLKDYTWGSWGNYDRRQFERNCKLYRVPYPFGATHINIKNLFALKYKLKREIGMMGALKILELAHIGKHHNGLDDAINIANILRELLK